MRKLDIVAGFAIFVLIVVVISWFLKPTCYSRNGEIYELNLESYNMRQECMSYSRSGELDKECVCFKELYDIDRRALNMSYGFLEECGDWGDNLPAGLVDFFEGAAKADKNVIGWECEE